MYKRYSVLTVLLSAVLLITAAGCGPSLVIQQVNYAQPVESVLSPDNNGVVHDRAHGLEFNISKLTQAESEGDTNEMTVEQVRLLRGHDGYYYVTAKGFKNVYIMKPADGSLELQKKVLIKEDGLGAPAFNQRDPQVQLVDQSDNSTYSLNKDGIIEEG